MVSFLTIGMFFSIPKAKAAEPPTFNLDLARQVIESQDVLERVTPSINQLHLNQPLANPEDGFISKPLIAETQITRQETRINNIQTNSTQKTKTKNIKPVIKENGELQARRFPYGYCTYYASQRRFVPWGGNAISWLSGAQSYGFATGSTPQVGAIIVTSEGGRTGHVGIVDAVNGDQVTISEMNFQGFGVISSRTISASYGRIMGYIY